MLQVTGNWRFKSLCTELIISFVYDKNWQCLFCRQDDSSKRLGRKEVNITKR